MEYMDAVYRQCLSCGIQNYCRLDKAKMFRRIRDEHVCDEHVCDEHVCGERASDEHSRDDKVIENEY